MPKRASEHIEPSRLFQKADSFDHASKALMRLPAPLAAHCGFAMVVNAAFACEAYLKVLAKLESGLQPLETHNLKFLVQDLLTETAARVRFEWERDYLPRIRDSWANPRAPKQFRPPQSFDQAIDQSSRAFIDWRYTPDPEKPLFFHMLDLPKIVRPIILEREPSFNRVYKLDRFDRDGNPERVRPGEYAFRTPLNRAIKPGSG